jgi:hypothetical protein
MPGVVAPDAEASMLLRLIAEFVFVAEERSGLTELEAI